MLIWVDNSTALSWAHLLFHSAPTLTDPQLELNPLPQKLTCLKYLRWDSQRIAQHCTWQEGVFDENADWQPWVPSFTPAFAVWDKIYHFDHFGLLFAYPTDKAIESCFFFKSNWRWMWEQQNLYIECKDPQAGAQKALMNAFLNNILISFLHPSK